MRRQKYMAIKKTTNLPRAPSDADLARAGKRTTDQPSRPPIIPVISYLESAIANRSQSSARGNLVRAGREVSCFRLLRLRFHELAIVARIEIQQSSAGCEVLSEHFSHAIGRSA
jgi:hypothetical protein